MFATMEDRTVCYFRNLQEFHLLWIAQAPNGQPLANRFFFLVFNSHDMTLKWDN